MAEHAGTVIELYNTPFWRSLALPWGGLITTGAGAITLLQQFEGVPPEFLSRALREEATRDQTGGLGGTMVVLQWPFCPWGLGVELWNGKSPHWAPVGGIDNVVRARGLERLPRLVGRRRDLGNP